MRNWLFIFSNIWRIVVHECSALRTDQGKRLVLFLLHVTNLMTQSYSINNSGYFLGFVWVFFLKKKKKFHEQHNLELVLQLFSN